MNTEEEIQKIKAEIDKIKSTKKKDTWDKLQIVSSLLIPVVLAILVYVQTNATEKAKQSTTDIQLYLDSLQNEREISVSRINSRVGQVNLVSHFFDALLVKNDDSRKQLAIKAILLALPEDGPDLVRVVSNSNNKDSITQFAKDELNERCNFLIQQMYSADASERINAFGDLFSGWKSNRGVIPKLINYANQNKSNTNGIYNTLVFLGQMNRDVLTNDVDTLKAFSHQFDSLGPKIAARGEKLRERLPEKN